jgi:hypothetical protein
MTYDVSFAQGDDDYFYTQIMAGGTSKDVSAASSIKLMMENDIGTIRHTITCAKDADIPITSANYVKLGLTVSDIGKTITFSSTEGWVTVHATAMETADSGVFFGNFIIKWGNEQHTAPSEENDLTINIKKRRFVEAV